jgi:Domain of unknown function (DUF4192)
MRVGALDLRLDADPAGRTGGRLGSLGGVSPGPGAQGTKDGPLGVGPMPVLSEPLGSSISVYGSAGIVRCRPPGCPAVVGREASYPQDDRSASLVCPQICARAHDLALGTQPADMTSSRKSTGKKSAKRRRRQPPQTQTRLKVRRPDDLLAIVPYLVGFHPEESLVAVVVRSGRVRLTVRMDIPPESASNEIAERIDALARREKAEALALIAYSAASLSANRLLTGLMDRLGGHRLTDVLYVGHGRWWSLTCGDDCCPLSGTPYDLSSHPMSASAVLAGMAARASRTELQESVSGPPPAELPRLQALAETLVGELEHLDDLDHAAALLAATLDAPVSDPRALDERTSLVLGLLVRDIRIRDLAWALISRANADDHVRLWGAVVARVPPTLAAAPLGLLGIGAWISGAGGLLNCCCERLSLVAPDYSMGKLLADISDRAVPPSLWDQIGGEVQAEVQAELGPLAS